MEKTTEKDILKYIDNFLSGPFGLTNGLPKESFKNFKILHDIKHHAYCVKEVKDSLQIQSAVRVHFVGSKDLNHIPEEELKKKPAWVELFNPYPVYKTPEFNNMTIPLHLRRWTLLLPVKTFLFIVSHEISHVLLYATRNPYRENEIATDIFSIIITGSELMDQGRKVYRDGKSEFVRNGFLFEEIEHTFGYLNDEQFEFACNAIRRKRGF